MTAPYSIIKLINPLKKGPWDRHPGPLIQYPMKNLNEYISANGTPFILTIPGLFVRRKNYVLCGKE